MADFNAIGTILEANDTVSGRIVVSATDAGFPHTVGPSGDPTSTFPIKIGSSINGKTGIIGTLVARVVPTTGVFKTYVVATADAGTTPAQTLVTVQDPSGFTVNGPADFIEPTREPTQVMAITGKVLTVKPKLVATHPKGSVALVPGGMKGYQLPANGRIGNIALPVVITSTINVYYQPFTPRINAPVVISAQIVGYTPPILRSGSIVTTVNSITATATGTSTQPYFGTISSTIKISAQINATSASQSGSINVGFFSSDPLDAQGTIVSMFGIGYTLMGTLAKPVNITATATGIVEPTGMINGTSIGLDADGDPVTIPNVVINAAIVGTSTAVTSLYGKVLIKGTAYGISGSQAGTIAPTIIITGTARGQAVGTANTAYGSINKALAITGVAVGKLSNTGRVFTPINVVIGAAIRGTTFLAPGLPVPTTFYFGKISGSGPVASIALSLGGSTGDMTISIDGADIMQPLAAASVSAPNIAAAINAAHLYTAKATDNFNLTIFALDGSGTAANGLVVSFRSSGNRTLNGTYSAVTGGLVGTLTGGQDGSVLIQSSATGKQYDDGTVTGALVATDLGIQCSATGAVQGNGGTIAATVVINGSLFDGFYGINIAKLNVNGVVAPPPTSMNVTKMNAFAHLITPPSALNVTKAVAYAVIGPDATSVSDTYQAVFFF